MFRWLWEKSTASLQQQIWENWFPDVYVTLELFQKKDILPEFYRFCFRFGMKSWPCLPRDGLISVTLDMTGGQKTSKYHLFSVVICSSRVRDLCDGTYVGQNVFISYRYNKSNNKWSRQYLIPSICDPNYMWFWQMKTTLVPVNFCSPLAPQQLLWKNWR